MRRETPSSGRAVASALLLLVVLLAAVPATPDVAAETASPPVFDLAAMVPHPLDVPEGYRQGNGTLHSGFDRSIHDPLFVPARMNSALTDRTRDLLRRTGWTRTYSNTIGQADPEHPEEYGRAIRFGLAEFGGAREAKIAHQGFDGLLRGAYLDFSAIALEDGTPATLALYGDEGNEDGRAPFLVFQVEHFLATLEFWDDAQDPFSAGDVAAVAEIFQQRIATVMERRDPTLGLQALRVRIGDDIPVTSEWYLRREGRDVPFVVGDGAAARLNAYGKATDVYSVSQSLDEDEDTDEVTTFLFRFPREGDARAWVPMWQEFLTSLGWEADYRAIDGRPDDQSWVYGTVEGSEEYPPASVLIAVDGQSAVAMIFYDAPALDVARALMSAQLACVGRDAPCAPVPLEAEVDAEAATAVADLVAIDRI